MTGVLVASSLVYLSAERLYRVQYKTEYQLRLDMAARDFLNLETAYDRIALNAAQVVRERLRTGHGQLTGPALAGLARELGGLEDRRDRHTRKVGGDERREDRRESLCLVPELPRAPHGKGR